MFVKRKVFVRRREGGLNILLDTVMLTGPFSRFSFRGGRVVFNVAPELKGRVPRGEVALDVGRIKGVWEDSNRRLYVAYDTENEDFYANYLARLPEGVEEITSLEKTVACILPNGRRSTNLDYCAEVDLAEGGVKWITEKVWERGPEPPKIEVQGEPRLTLVTDENIKAVAERLLPQLGQFKRVSETWRGPSSHEGPVLVGAESRSVEVNGAEVRVTSGYGYWEASGPDEEYVGDFGYYVCVFPPEGAKGVCGYRPDPGVVEALARENYGAFVGLLDFLRRQYGDDLVRRHVRWDERYAEMLVEAFPDLFADKLGEIARAVAEAASGGRNASVYGSRVSTWIDTLRKLEAKGYLTPDAKQALDEAVRKYEEVVRREREEEERKWEEVKRELEAKKRRREEEVERLMRELGEWGEYVGLERRGDYVVVVRKRFIPSDRFNALVTKLKELGFRFDPRSKEWRHYLQAILARV